MIQFLPSSPLLAAPQSGLSQTSGGSGGFANLLGLAGSGSLSQSALALFRGLGDPTGMGLGLNAEDLNEDLIGGDEGAAGLDPQNLMAILLGLGNGSGGNDQASQSDALQSLTANGNPSAKSGASALGVAPTASQNGTDGSTGLSTTPGTTIPTDSPDWVSPFAASGNNSQSGSPVLASLTQAAHSLALAEGGEPESRHPAADSNLPPLNGPASVHAVRLAGAAVAEPSPTDPTRLVRQISEPIHQIAAGRLSPNSLTVHLSPPELGRVEIDVTRNSQEHSRIEVVIRVERPETERLLEQTMHRLHESLENRGVDLGNLRLDFTGSQRQQGWANDAQTHDETFQESIVETQSPKPTRVPFVDGSRLSVVV